jgi:hypothetical protein
MTFLWASLILSRGAFSLFKDKKGKAQTVEFLHMIIQRKEKGLDYDYGIEMWKFYINAVSMCFPFQAFPHSSIQPSIGYEL